MLNLYFLHSKIKLTTQEKSKIDYRKKVSSNRIKIRLVLDSTLYVYVNNFTGVK